MKITIELTPQEAATCISGLIQPVGSAEDIVLAVERLQELHHQSLREQRRTTRSVARIARNTSESLLMSEYDFTDLEDTEADEDAEDATEGAADDTDTDDSGIYDDGR